ncbi:MAG: PAS domain-containing protein, partial [Planctomycetia bacterium]|nr:PAS domain-containing protein [Planctomycetia bacterium]
MGSHDEIKEMGWGILAEIDEQEALAPLAKLRLLFGGLMVVVALAAWLLGLLVSRAVSGPIQRLHKGTEIIGQGNLDYKVGTDANDEIGQLSRAFDSMTENLKKTTASRDELTREIAERKRAEEKTKQIAEEWSMTFDAITDLVSIQDKEFRLVRVNKAYADLLNAKPEELVGKICYEVIHGTKEPPAGCPHKQAVASGKAVTEEFFDPRLGIHFQISVSPLFDERVQVTGTVHIAKDITERKRAEEQMQNLAKFPSENPNPVLRVARDGAILYANHAGTELFNDWPCEIGNVVPDSWRKSVAEVLEAGSKKEIEVERDRRIFSFVIAPVSDAGYVNVYGRDVTERKRAEEAARRNEQRLQRANEELERSNKDLQDFTFAVSHDLQEPLRKIHAFGQFLAEDCGDEVSEKGGDYIRRMSDATRRMSTLIHDLLALSRVGTKGGELEPVEPSEVVKEVLEMLSVQSAETGAEVKVDPLPPVMADKTQLGQLFQNLIGNALKFRSAERASRIAISGEANGEFVTFRVTDNGIGIEKR